MPFLFQDFLEYLELVPEKEISDVISTEVFRLYVVKCVQLCLLMNANDPPVVLHCPGWARQNVFPTAEQPIGNRDKRSFDISLKEKRRSPHTQLKLCINLDLEQNPVGRSTFDKDKFKDYTRRGCFLEYVVWPAILLYKDGPLLSKGVAQGTDIQLIYDRKTSQIIRNNTST